MTTDEFETFSAQLVVLGELFEKQLSVSQQLLYFEALRDLELDPVLRAITQAARECKFFPKPVELRTFAVGDDAVHAEDAWQTYKRMAAEIGGYVSPMFSDAALAETLVAVFGSWEQACWIDLSPEMWASKRKEFDRVYRILRQRGVSGHRTLPSFCERENLLKGYSADGQRRLRDVERRELPAAPKQLPEATEAM